MAGPNALRPSAGRILQSCSSSRSAHLSIVPPSASRIAQFSTTAPQCKRKTKDNNKTRGVSSLYRSGPREPLSMSNVSLPKPRDFKPKVTTDENHGLWGFFPETGKALWTPKEAEQHGRAWTVEELRKKSWEDLHSLWWVCCRERNMLATSQAELARSKLGFGEREIDDRDAEVRKTMRSIKHALTERFYTWSDAVDVAMSDPEIDLAGGDGQVYKPSTYEDDPTGEEWAQLNSESADVAKEEAKAPADTVAAAEQPVKAEKEATR